MAESNPHRQGGINPLRPYYVAPTIGEPPIRPSNIFSPTAFSRHKNGTIASGTSSAKYATKARDVLSDLDYKDYISESSPSVVGNVKDIINELMWKYTSVLLAQPFEVAKFILQVRIQDNVGALGALPVVTPLPAVLRQTSSKASSFDDFSDSEGEEPAYFTSNISRTPSPVRSRQRRSVTPSETPNKNRNPDLEIHMLSIRHPDSILEVLSQLWQKEGIWGVCKGTNATFVYKVLQSLLENWSRSLLSALFDVPDLGLKKDFDRLVDIASPYPWASLWVAAAAAVITGLILSPLDLVRTRSIITSTSRGPRRTLALLRSLPSYLCPTSLVLPTIFHSLVQPVLKLSTPLVLRTKLIIDSEVSPSTFSLAKFCTSIVVLFISLPLETSLRRGQVAVLSQIAYVRAIEGGVAADPTATETLETIVPPGRYDGIFGTMYTIVNEEGSRIVPMAPAARAARGVVKRSKNKIAETVYRRGQGVQGLWRGWKVSWWGLVGLWGASVVGGGGDGEF